MTRVLILTHGALAHELLSAARRIAARELEGFVALSLDWDDSSELAKRKTRAHLDDLPAGDPVLVLTDMYGGTPHNVAASFHRPGRVEVVTGVNLPMVLRLGCPGTIDLPLPQLVDWLVEKGRGSICANSDPAAVRPGCDE